MIRRAFTLRLKPGALEEYIRRHDEIWPELVAEIEKEGIAHISSFEADGTIFLFSEVRDEGSWDRLWDSEVHRRWAKVFEPLIDVREDGIVDSGDLREIWHLETGG